MSTESRTWSEKLPAAARYTEVSSSTSRKRENRSGAAEYGDTTHP